MSPALKARDCKGPSSDGDGDGAPLIVHSLRAAGFDASEDGTGRGTPLVAPGFIHPRQLRNSQSSNQIGIKPDAQVSDALTSEGPGAVFSVALRGRDGGATAEVGDDRAHALRASSGGGDKPHVLTPAVAFRWQTGGDPSNSMNVSAESPTLDRGPVPAIAFHTTQDPISGPQVPAISRNSMGQGVAGGVRRLTPRECERLQGFPDDWTLVPFRGKPASDGPRCRAIGNSMAVPVMRWIGQRIAAVEALLRRRAA